jgi:hypothetical protein
MRFVNADHGELKTSGEIPRNLQVASEMHIAWPPLWGDGLGVNNMTGDDVSIRTDKPDLGAACISRRSSSTRVRQGKVTKADYERAAEFLRSMGAVPAAVEIAPNSVRIVTSHGSDMTLAANQDDIELAAWAAEHG